MQLSAHFIVFMIIDPENKRMQILIIAVTLFTIVTGLLAIQREDYDYGKMQKVQFNVLNFAFALF